MLYPVFRIRNSMDPHQSEKVEALEGHFRALEGPNLEKKIEIRLKGRIRIQIRKRVKDRIRIRIRIKVKSRIRIRGSATLYRYL